MRLEAAFAGVVYATSVLATAALGRDVEARSPQRSDPHANHKRDAQPNPTPTLKILKKRNDVYKATIWPTVAVPAGFTLAGGVQVTPLPNAQAEGIAAGLALSGPAATATAFAEVDLMNSQIDQRCFEVVSRLVGVANNPSGMTACYNVPFLDTNKGIFESELRVFNVSMPSGEFVGTTSDSMMITFQYQFATLSSSDGALPVQKRSLSHTHLVARQIGAPPPPQINQAQNGVWQPKEISVRKYVGQLNPGTFQPGMNISAFKNLLTPQITLSANNPSLQRTVQAALSPTEASFVIGLFTDENGSYQDPSFLLDKPAAKIEAAAQGLPTPFIVPGLSLGVFPTGLIIVLLWTMTFFGVVGYGTLGRMKFRDEYRAAVKAAGGAPAPPPKTL